MWEFQRKNQKLLLRKNRSIEGVKKALAYLERADGENPVA